MQGKASIVVFALLSVFFISSLSIAANPSKDLTQTKIYKTQLGCMSCHQGENFQLVETPKKPKINKRQNKIADKTD